jgi:hypothetical protein
MEELFHEVILPRLQDASAEDIDELVSLLLEQRQKKRKTGPRARLPPSPIEAGLDTTGWLRENQLVKRPAGSAAPLDGNGSHSNLIGDGVGRAKSRATQHSQQPDRLSGYDAEAKLRERVKFINAMLNSPAGAHSTTIDAPMAGSRRRPGATIGGNPAAFRMRDRNVYSKVCAAMVVFH